MNRTEAAGNNLPFSLQPSFHELTDRWDESQKQHLCQIIENLGLKQKGRLFNLSQPPNYKASMVSSKESEGDSSGTAIVLLPGIWRTARDTAQIAANLYTTAHGLNRFATPWTATLSSSIGMDTLNTPLPSPIERAAYQAELIYQLLSKHPAEQIILASHSFGATEIVCVEEIFRGLIEASDSRVKTKIKGIIMAQAGGQYRQSIPEFLNKARTVKSYGEIGKTFPSPIDVYRLKGKLDRERENGIRGYGNAGEVIKLEDQLKEAEARLEKPELEPDSSILLRLKELDKKIDSAWGADPHKVNRLLEERDNLLGPFIDRIMAGTPLNNEILVRSARVLHEIISPASKKVRNLVHCPVALVIGETDGYFPSAEFDNRIDRHPFPNSSQVFNALIKGWPHQGMYTDTSEFSAIMIDLIERMRAIPNDKAASSPIRLSY